MSKNYKNTTVGVPVFERVESTRYSLQSAYDYGFRKFVVVDDGEITEEKKKLYSEFQQKIDDFTVIDLDYDTGVSAKRNRIVEETDTDYLLLMDSDNSIVNVEHAYEILEENKDIGGVSGLIVEYDRLKLVNLDLNENRNCMTKDSRNVEYSEEYGCYICDFIPQCGLFRMDIFDDSVWDENFKVGYEHFDFFLSFKDTKWKFASSPAVAFEHEMKCDSMSVWSGDSKRLKEAEEYFLEKWEFDDQFVVRTGLVDSKREGRNKVIEMLYGCLPLRILKLIDKVL